MCVSQIVLLYTLNLQSAIYQLYLNKIERKNTCIYIYIGEGSGNPLQYSCLENPMDGGAWQAAVHGVSKSQTRLNDFTFTFMRRRRKWQPTPVFLPGESQGWGSLVGCHLQGRTESDMTEATQQQQEEECSLFPNNKAGNL